MTDITVRLYEWYSYLPDDDKNRVLVGDAMDEINRLRSTIEHLRAVAGAVNIERPFTDIKKEIRDGK